VVKKSLLFREFQKLLKWFQNLRSGFPLERGIARLDFNKINVCIKAPLKRDYMSDLIRLMYASRRRPIDNAQHTWVCEHLSEACAAPRSKKSDANPACGATQPLGLRWGFETTSKHSCGVTVAKHLNHTSGINYKITFIKKMNSACQARMKFTWLKF